jgi:hypothetical protein
MIAKYEKQAIKSAVAFGIAAGVALVSMLVAMAMTNEPIGLGIFLTLTLAGGLLAMLILYFRACFYLAKAKGYTTIVFLILFAPPLLALFPGLALVAGVIELVILPVTLLLLEDKSNPAKEAEEEKYQGPRCVCCNIRISPTLKVCPKCGWTQPAVENLAVA